MLYILWSCEYHYTHDLLLHMSLTDPGALRPELEQRVSSPVFVSAKMSSREDDNPHSVSSILTSTPRSKAKKSRKRRLTHRLSPRGPLLLLLLLMLPPAMMALQVLNLAHYLRSLIVYLASSTVSSIRAVPILVHRKLLAALLRWVRWMLCGYLFLLLQGYASIKSCMYPVPRWVDQLKCDNL